MRDDWRELTGKASGEVMTVVGPRRHLGRTKPEGIVGWLKEQPGGWNAVPVSTAMT